MSFSASFIVIKNKNIDNLKSEFAKIGYVQKEQAIKMDFYDALGSDELVAGIYNGKIIIAGSDIVANIFNNVDMGFEEQAMIDSFPLSDILVVSYSDAVGAGLFNLIKKGRRIRFINGYDADIGERLPIESEIIKRNKLLDYFDINSDDDSVVHQLNEAVGFDVAEKLGSQYLGFDFTSLTPQMMNFISFKRDWKPEIKNNQILPKEETEGANNIVVMFLPLEEGDSIYLGVKISWQVKEVLVFEYAKNIINQAINNEANYLKNANGKIKLLFMERINSDKQKEIIECFQDINDLSISFGLYDEYGTDFRKFFKREK